MATKRYVYSFRLAYYSAHAYIGTGDDTLICVRTGVYTLLAHVNRLAYYSAHAYIETGDDTLICVRTGVYTLLAYV